VRRRIGTRFSWRADPARPQSAQARRGDSGSARSAQQQLADLQAKQTDRGVVVTLGDVLFDTGQATLKPGLTSRSIAGELSELQSAHEVLIEGHTDSRGSDPVQRGAVGATRTRGCGCVGVGGIPADQVQTLAAARAIRCEQRHA